jgi:glycosyltransferase involved in cell wall biosynthesis
MAQENRWSFVVFGYNEVEALPHTLKGILSTIEKMQPSDYELIMVDDGSRDGSQDLIREMATRYPRMVLAFHPVNRGIGEALRTGYSQCRFENVCALPADGQFDSEELLAVPLLQDGQFVSFYRTARPAYTRFRRALSYTNFVINKLLLGMGLNDINWVKIYRLNDLRKLHLELRSSLVETELCFKLLRSGCQCIEYPSKYVPRITGVARGASLNIVSKALKDLSRLLSVCLKFQVANVLRAFKTRSESL